MLNSLIFLMGKFEAHLPGDRRYCKNHMWCQPDGTRWRFGFTSYAVRLMQDVYFLEWNLEPGTAVEVKQLIGHIETSKAMSDLFAPLTGTLIEFNSALMDDPSTINASLYDRGWLFAMEPSPPAEEQTLSVQEYYQFLDANWEKTQNMLKGHM